MPIIDVHTHMFTRHWLELLGERGDPYYLQVRPDGRDEIFRGQTPVVFPYFYNSLNAGSPKVEGYKVDQLGSIYLSKTSLA